MEKLVELSDQEIRIDFALGCKCRRNIHLKSLTAACHVAFKVQTSSPHKFLVNPPSGLIPPLGSATFQIVLKPQSQLPTTFPRSLSDRFLLKTAPAPEFGESSKSTQCELVNSWFNSDQGRPTHDTKLRVYFVGTFLLKHAVGSGDYDAVRNLIKRQRSILAELPSQEADSLYGVASQLGGESGDNMVGLLLEAGLRITEGRKGGPSENDVIRRGWSELHAAAAFDRVEEVAAAELESRDREGRTPLHLAAGKGHLRSAKVLVGAGANVDASSKDGRTALYRAAANGDVPMVEMLLDAGADPTIGDMELGRSAIAIARDKGHNEVVKILEQGEAVLHATRRGELELLESLLEKGASTSFCDQYGLTALHVAATKGYKDAVMLLAEFGANLDILDAEGHTPLHFAVEGGSIETVEVLISRGANVNAKSTIGATPLYISKMMEYDDITRLLYDNGAAS